MQKLSNSDYLTFKKRGWTSLNISFSIFAGRAFVKTCLETLLDDKLN